MVKKETEVQKEAKPNYAAPIVCAIVVLMAVVTVVVAAVTLNNQGAESSENNDGSKDEALTDIGSQGLLDFLAEKKTGFVYVGRPTCPHCQVFAPILKKVVKEDGLEVFYYNTDAANDDKELKTKTLKAVSVTGVPSFLYIKDGVEVGRLPDEDKESEPKLREFIKRMREENGAV